SGCETLPDNREHPGDGVISARPVAGTGIAPTPRDSAAACAGGWLVEPIATGDHVAVHSAGVVVGGQGEAHVVYSELIDDGDRVIGGMLQHAAEGASGWSVKTVDGPRVSGLYTALAADAWGGLHALYTKAHSVEYAYRPEGGSWSTTELDSFDDDVLP